VAVTLELPEGYSRIFTVFLHDRFARTKFNDIIGQIQSIRINLVKATGHDSTYGNELADQHARDKAKMIAYGNISAPSNITTDDAYKIASEISIKSWQHYWDHESKGRYTYHMIPSVGTKVTFPGCRDIGISYCRILIHDTMLKSDSYRTGISDTSLCECGKGEETIEHFLLHCGIYAEARCDMMDCL